MTREIAPWAILVCAILVGLWFTTLKKRSTQVWETTPGGPYEVTVTETELSCTHPMRPKESIRWDDIKEIDLVRTSDGPFLPDMWFLFIGDNGGCSIPSEAKGFEPLWDEFRNRFPEFDHAAILGSSNSKKVLWKR